MAAVDDAHEQAFADIDADPRNLLVVVDDDGDAVAYLQSTYIPGSKAIAVGEPAR